MLIKSSIPNSSSIIVFDWLIAIKIFSRLFKNNLVWFNFCSSPNLGSTDSNWLNDSLTHLKLENANFKVKFEELELENATEIGMDRVIFLASTNSGADALPINKIASGGELSRFLLAIKVVLETMVHQRTIIFDEIDSGIGGAAANAVGNRLAKLGNNYQTMVVTHSPQVTSKGHYHYLVQKNNNNNNITTNVTQLNETERVEEIARMVSGSVITNEAREAASKLLNNWKYEYRNS